MTQMSSLRSLQIMIQTAVLQREQSSLIISENFRLAIYRNSVRIKHFQALKKIYPTVYKLVGADFFKQLSKEYQMAHPSSHWSLSEFGRMLPHFLLSYHRVQHLAYLPAVSRLEWAIHEVLQDGISKALVFEYPVMDIWQFCQGPAERQDALHLKSNGNNLFLKLNSFQVDIQSLDD